VNFEPMKDNKFQVGISSDIGKRYKVNQDFYKSDRGRGIFLLADGIGGGPAGEVASQIAVNSAHAYLAKAFKGGYETDPGPILLEAIHTANQAIKAAIAQAPAYRGMGTTLVVAWLLPSQALLWAAHIGDSRAYLLRQASLEQLTNDHTVLNAVRQANMLPEDPKRWPPRSLLSQSLGSSDMIAPDVTKYELLQGDLVFLCSDGISDTLDYSKIQSLLSLNHHPQVICEEIIRVALEQGASDNLTTLAVRVLPPDQSTITTQVHIPR